MVHNNTPSFHIPVLGIGYSVDTPIKVAHYGITSVVSLVDDVLLEDLRKFYSEKFDLTFSEISNKIDDFRAKRITAYLDMVDKVTADNFKNLKESITEKISDIDKYMDMLPDFSNLKSNFSNFIKKNTIKKDINTWLNNNLSLGDIDVNIMTKLDKENYKGKEQLPIEYNDALAALRGFANSTLSSSVVLSAGMNPRLYSYFEEFMDFYPDVNGVSKKNIILKVSDYRSALIQGKILAKKGIWISEYRVESGLNCGGHAFATEGLLLGPILEEFKSKKSELIETTHEIYVKALKEKDFSVPTKPRSVKLTAQGGVGTNNEHSFLIDHYKVESVGWGTPFMLVPEAVDSDQHTIDLLANSKESDLYLSTTSPLGVLFNSIKGNTMDKNRDELIKKGKPGSPCFKKYASVNTEFTKNTICAASRQYQRIKLKELSDKDISKEQHDFEFERIVEKSCICTGLGISTMLAKNIDTKKYGSSVSICPGPNIAYFDKEMSLKEMVDHIYGRDNMISRKDRPNMFVNELKMYVDYLKKSITEASRPLSTKDSRYFKKFKNNLNSGISYYLNLIKEYQETFISFEDSFEKDIYSLQDELSKVEFE